MKVDVEREREKRQTEMPRSKQRYRGTEDRGNESNRQTEQRTNKETKGETRIQTQIQTDRDTDRQRYRLTRQQILCHCKINLLLIGLSRDKSK